MRKKFKKMESEKVKKQLDKKRNINPKKTESKRVRYYRRHVGDTKKEMRKKLKGHKEKQWRKT